MRRVLLKSIVPLFLWLALTAPAFGQFPAENSAGEPVCVTVFTQSVDIKGAMNISGWPRSAPGAVCTSEIVAEPFISKLPSYGEPVTIPGPLPHVYYMKTGVVVFNGPVRILTGLAIGGSFGDSVLDQGAAVFNGPVDIGGDLGARGRSRAVFFKAVNIGRGEISLEDSVYGRSALTFHGPVNVKGGGIALSGENEAVFKNEVRLESGGLIMDRADGRASVTLGGQARVTAGKLKAIGGNRLIFTLTPSRLAGGYIKADSVEIDADCLVIDNPDNVVGEESEILLIIGKELKLTGDNRRIVTKQGDEFELLVNGNQISALMTRQAVKKAVWDDDDDLANHTSMIGRPCGNGGVCGRENKAAGVEVLWSLWYTRMISGRFWAEGGSCGGSRRPVLIPGGRPGRTIR